MAIQALADGRVLAERIGESPARVVALHGWGRTGSDFVGILDGVNSLAIHLPGFGPTSTPETAWGTDDYARVIADAIEPLGPVVLVGHSFGGRIAVRLAASRPELVSALVLTGAPLVRLTPPSSPSLAFRILKALKRLGLLSDAMLESRRKKMGSADYNAAHGVMRDILVKTVNENYDADLARIAVPTWLVWGEHDTAAPTAAGQVASERIRGARWIVVPGEAHLLTPKLGVAVRAAVEEALA